MSEGTKEETLAFDEVVALLKGADVVMLVPDGDGDSVLANFTGFDEDGDDESDFSVGAEGWDDVSLGRGNAATLTTHEGMLGLRFPCCYCTVVPLYGKAV